MERIKRIGPSIVAFILSFAVLSTVVSAAWSSLGVSLKRQAKSQWCWAASLEMCANYLGYSDYDQWDIVRAVKGTFLNPYPNEPGVASDYRDGMEYATDDDYTASRTNTVLTLTQVKNKIDNNMPIILAIGTYNSSGSRTSGHAIVCYAVDSTAKKVRSRDPAQDSVREDYYPTLTDSSRTSYCDGTAIISEN